MRKQSLPAWARSVINQSLDLDGSFGPQCMDLVNHYAQTCLGIPRFWGNAIDVSRQKPVGMRWEENRPFNAPPPGAVVVWGPTGPPASISEFGHVAVALVADPHYLVSIDQNWLGEPRVRAIGHTYQGCLGWLTPLF